MRSRAPLVHADERRDPRRCTREADSPLWKPRADGALVTPCPAVQISAYVWRRGATGTARPRRGEVEDRGLRVKQPARGSARSNVATRAQNATLKRRCIAPRNAQSSTERVSVSEIPGDRGRAAVLTFTLESRRP